MSAACPLYDCSTALSRLYFRSVSAPCPLYVRSVSAPCPRYVRSTSALCLLPHQGAVSSGMALLALEYVRDTFPWMNATTGHNHILAFSYDFGGCPVAGTPIVRAARAPCARSSAARLVRLARGPIRLARGPVRLARCPVRLARCPVRLARYPMLAGPRHSSHSARQPEELNWQE